MVFLLFNTKAELTLLVNSEEYERLFEKSGENEFINEYKTSEKPEMLIFKFNIYPGILIRRFECVNLILKIVF